jgi:hypothetical protein
MAGAETKLVRKLGMLRELTGWWWGVLMGALQIASSW